MEFFLYLDGIGNEEARIAASQIKELPQVESITPATEAASSPARAMDVAIFSQLLVKVAAPVLAKFLVSVIELFNRPGAQSGSIIFKSKDGSIELKFDPRNTSFQEVVAGAEKLISATRGK
jgi:hypothetical protein